MFCEQEKMRSEVRENGGFLREMFEGKTPVACRSILERKYERTLRNYCRVLGVSGISKLRKNTMIDVIIEHAKERGLLDLTDYAAAFEHTLATTRMTNLNRAYKYFGYVANLVKLGSELKAEALTCDVKALPATIETPEVVTLSSTEIEPYSDQDFYYIDMIPETDIKAIALSEPVREPEPEIIEVEAIEVKKYPVEFCTEMKRRPWGRKTFVRTSQIKIFPRAFMYDESNLIRNTKPGVRGE